MLLVPLERDARGSAAACPHEPAAIAGERGDGAWEHARPTSFAGEVDAVALRAHLDGRIWTDAGHRIADPGCHSLPAGAAVTQ